MALGLLHVYSTYREGIYRGVGITQITLHFPRRKKKYGRRQLSPIALQQPPALPGSGKGCAEKSCTQGCVIEAEHLH